MDKLVVIAIIVLFLIIGCTAKEIQKETVNKLGQEQDMIEELKPEEDITYTEAQCEEICAKKGFDYYGDCAYDILGLDSERVGTCYDSSKEGWPCNEKSCGCYCVLPLPT